MLLHSRNEVLPDQRRRQTCHQARAPCTHSDYWHRPDKLRDGCEDIAAEVRVVDAGGITGHGGENRLDREKMVGE